MQTIQKAGAQSDSAPFSFVLSTEDVDRMGDVVMQSGISLQQFKKNPVALFAHSARMPIGTWENLRREGNALVADLKLAARGTSRVIDELRSLIEQRILRAASIGFGVNKAEPLDPEKPYGGQRFTKTELLEASLVAVPANPNALMLRSLSAEARALVFSDVARGNEPLTPQSAAAPAAHAAEQSAARQRKTPMNIAEKIKAARERLTVIDARVTELKAIAEGVDALSDDQAGEVSTLSDERATVEKNIANLEKLEKLLAERAEPATALVRTPAVIHSRGRDSEVPGTILSRMALCHLFAHMERRSVFDVVRDRYAADQRIEAVLRAAVPGADSTTAGWAKELVAVDVKGFIDALVPVSAYAGVASRGLVVDFGTAGSISVPFRGGANTDLGGAWVGEQGAIPVKRGTISAATLARYKLGVISVLSKELSRSSTPQAEQLIRQMMADDTSVVLDQAFFSAAGGNVGINPPGILNGVAALPNSVLVGKIDAAVADLNALVTSIVAAGNGRRIVIAMNTAQRLSLASMFSAGTWMFRDEVAQGRVLGVELVASSNISPGEVVAIDCANLVSGLGSPEFDANDATTLVMADAGGAAPTQATAVGDVTAIGAAEKVPPDGGLSVYNPLQHAAGKAGEGAMAVSMFQTWQIALRTVLPISWAKGRPGSVAWIAAVTW